MFARIFGARSNKSTNSFDKRPTSWRGSPPSKDKDKAQSFPRAAPARELRRKGSAEDVSKKSAKVQLPLPTLELLASKEPLILGEEDVQAMTANYKTLLGKGGFGFVYKGHIVDSGTKKKVPVAVKVLHSEQQGCLEEDLMREIVAVAQLHHLNILKLLGYCNAQDTKVLVYDFMGGGDVDDLLRKSREGVKEFPWEQRLEVALGCAKALAFMHDQNFVHRDFKSSNVLLTEDLSPRVADFGLVKFIQDWHSHCTTRVKGSIGYIDPMYFTIGHVHTKSDVYAFGVFLVELITGKSVHGDRIHETVIPDLHAGKVTEALLLQILDPRISREDKASLHQAKALAELARRSMQDHWEGRPNMKDLIQKINRIKASKANNRHTF